jgi:hypothetical protein
MIENMLIVDPVTSNARSTPTSERGYDAMIARGWREDANWEARSM